MESHRILTADGKSQGQHLNGWASWYSINPYNGLEVFCKGVEPELQKKSKLTGSERTKLALQAAKDGNVEQLQEQMGEIG